MRLDKQRSADRNSCFLELAGSLFENTSRAALTFPGRNECFSLGFFTAAPDPLTLRAQLPPPTQCSRLSLPPAEPVSYSSRFPTSGPLFMACASHTGSFMFPNDQSHQTPSLVQGSCCNGSPLERFPSFPVHLSQAVGKVLPHLNSP